MSPHRLKAPRWSDGDGGREYLRSLPVLTGTAPAFDTDDTPAEPVTLFIRWLQDAVEAALPEPHAMTLSTVDSRGFPQARVLIIKAVDERGWHFAVNASSQKGRELSANPVAALTFYWPGLVRPVRISGVVINDGAQASAQDFLARPLESRAMALTMKQSQPLTNGAELDAEIAHAHRKLDKNPKIIPPEWISYAVRAEYVEFWQGAADRRHQRLRYERNDERWDRRRLWP